MQREPVGRDVVRSVSDTSGSEKSASERDDWTARHARTRTAPDGPNVRADEPDDLEKDWTRRHSRTAR